MNKINIKVKISNEDMPYLYEGVAKEYNDIIEYDYLGENFIFDKKIKRVTKDQGNSIIVVDFLSKEIIIKSNSKELKICFDLIKEETSNSKYYYLYKIDDKKIEFLLEKEV